MFEKVGIARLVHMDVPGAMNKVRQFSSREKSSGACTSRGDWSGAIRVGVYQGCLFLTSLCCTEHLFGARIFTPITPWVPAGEGEFLQLVLR